MLASRGAGLGTTRALAETMRRAGARLDTSMAVEMTGYVWLDAAGRIVHAHARQSSSSTWSRVLQSDISPRHPYLATTYLVTP